MLPLVPEARLHRQPLADCMQQPIMALKHAAALRTWGGGASSCRAFSIAAVADATRAARLRCRRPAPPPKPPLLRQRPVPRHCSDARTAICNDLGDFSAWRTHRRTSDDANRKNTDSTRRTLRSYGSWPTRLSTEYSNVPASISTRITQHEPSPSDFKGAPRSTCMAWSQRKCRPNS